MQTMGKRLDSLRVAILVTDDFEQVELTEPKKALEQVGATTKIIARKAGTVQGMNHDEKADSFPVKVTGLFKSPSFSHFLFSSFALMIGPPKHKIFRSL